MASQSWRTFREWGEVVLPGILAAALSAGLFVLWHGSLFRARRLYSNATAGMRLGLLRRPSQAFAPYKPEEPPDLSALDTLVREKLQSNPADWRWRAMAGRMYLAEGDLLRAVQNLEAAVSDGDPLPGVKVDLAIAYAEREKNLRPNLLSSLDLLLKAMEDPRSSPEELNTARFDTALIYEKMRMWDLAESAWNKFLSGRDGEGWSAEAQEHLQNDVEQQKNAGAVCNAFLQTQSGPIPPEDAEICLDAAMADILPGFGFTAARQADIELRQLSQLMKRQHGDPWLEDLLKAKHNPEGVRDLGRSFVANKEGQYDDAILYAGKAQKAFGGAGNQAGDLRARFEEAYAWQRRLRGRDCLAKAQPLARDLNGTSYHWLQVQASIELGLCSQYNKQMDESSHSFSEAHETAVRYGLHVAALRSRGISASVHRDRHEFDAAWQEEITGVEEYWKVRNPPMRLYQFYSEIELLGEKIQDWRAAEAVQRRALAVIRDDRDHKLIGVAHLKLAAILAAERKDAAADDEFRAGYEILRQAVPDSSLPTYILTRQSDYAKNLNAGGQYKAALDLLTKTADLVNKSDNSSIQLAYHVARGDAELNLHRDDAAIESYCAALEIAESGFVGAAEESNIVGWSQATEPAYRGLTRGLVRREKPEDALAVRELHSVRTMGLPFPGSNCSSLASIKREFHTAAGETRIIYALFPDGIAIWTPGARKSPFLWREFRTGEAAIQSIAAEFIRQCADRNSNMADIQRNAEILYAYFLQPVLTYAAPNGKLVLEMDHPLQGLPVEALRSPEGWYLGARFQIMYSPGLLIENFLRSPRRLTEGRALALDGIEDPGSLPGHAEEMSAMHRAFPGLVTRSAHDYPWEIARKSISKSNVIVFVGHGAASGTSVGLAFGEKKMVRPSDFSPEEIKDARLVVLSACSTGPERDLGLFDPDSFTRRFFHSGVGSVVVSRWNVDSLATAQLMAHFYSRIQSGEGTERAIFFARQELMNQRPHPFFWAGFNVAGRSSGN